MKIIHKSKLEGVLVLEPTIFKDDRGYFYESYNKNTMQSLGIDCEFVQDNESFSSGKVIRGMHYQASPGQAKLLRVLEGEVLDVVVDLRKNSPTFKQWDSFKLGLTNSNAVFIPKGFGHGFAVLTPEARVAYKCSSVYNGEQERSLRYDDPEIGIEWPIEDPTISKRDQLAPSFEDLDLEEICYV